MMNVEIGAVLNLPSISILLRQGEESGVARVEALPPKERVLRSGDIFLSFCF